MGLAPVVTFSLACGSAVEAIGSKADSGSGAGDGSGAADTTYTTMYSVVSTYGPPPTTSGGGCEGHTVPFDDFACEGCAESLCCPELSACGQDCIACLNDSPGCSPEGQAQADALTSCIDQSCPFTCFAICDTQLTTGSAACDGCLGDACCAEFQDCVDDPDCFACITGADPPACDATGLDEPVISCSIDSCSEVCPALFGEAR